MIFDKMSNLCIWGKYNIFKMAQEAYFHKRKANLEPTSPCKKTLPIDQRAQDKTLKLLS